MERGALRTRPLTEGLLLLSGAFGLVFLFFGYHLFGKLPVSTDLSMLHLQFFAFRFDGSLPLWNPYAGAGMAMHSDLQFAPLYPLRWPFFFLPWADWLNAYLALHYFIALLGTYGLLRSAGLSRVAASGGAVAYLCGGFMLAYVITITVFCAACWLPLLIWGTITPRRYGSPLAGLAIAMIVASGSPHLMVYGTAGFLTAMAVRSVARDGGAGKRLREAGRSLVFFVLGIAVSGASLISGLFQASQSVRQNVDVRINLEDSVAWGDLPTSLFGGAGGAVYPEINDRALYIGGVGLVLALMGLMTRAPVERRASWNTLRWTSLLLVGIGVALALGEHAGWHHVLPYIPGLRLLAGPARALVISALGMSVLIGLGVDAAARSGWRRRALAIAIAALLAGGVLGVHAGDRPERYLTEYLQRWVVHPAAVIGPAFMWIDLPLTGLVGGLALMAAPMLKSGARPILLILLVAQFLHFSGRVLPRAEKKEFFDPPPPVRYLASQPEQPPFRVSAIDPLQATDTEWDSRFKYHFLQPNSASLYRLEAISLYNPLMNREYREFIRDHCGQAPFNDPLRQVIPARHDDDLYQDLNVRFIVGHPRERRVSHTPFAIDGVHPVAEVDEWEGRDAGPVEAWKFVSFLSGPKRVQPGERVAELIFQREEEVVRCPVIYGKHTAFMDDDPLRDESLSVRPQSVWTRFLPPGSPFMEAASRSFRSSIELDRPVEAEHVYWRLLREDLALQVSAQAAQLAGEDGETPVWTLRHPHPVAPVYERDDAAPRVRFLAGGGGGVNREIETNLAALRPIDLEYEEHRHSASRFRVRAPDEGLLVIATTWHPAWRAWVDGEPEPVRRVNGLFQGVRTPAGTHEIEMRFVPALFFALLIPGALAAGILLLSLIRGLRPETGGTA